MANKYPQLLSVRFYFINNLISLNVYSKLDFSSNQKDYY